MAEGPTNRVLTPDERAALKAAAELVAKYRAAGHSYLTSEEYSDAIDRYLDLSTEDVILALLREVEQLRAAFDLRAHLARQRVFSERTFGPGQRTAGVVDHIRKELGEIERKPSDLSEWIDVVILALDGAWRAGYSPEAIIEALVAKQGKNEARQWPDWRTAPTDRAIEHVRGESSHE